MAIFLKQSTQIDVRIGPFVDVGDGFTPETGITLSGADEAELLKADGTGTVDISSNTWAAVTGADGWYDLTLSTTDTNTVGELVVVVQDDSVCLPVFQRFQVVEEAIYDSIFAASAAGFDGNQRVDVGSWLGTAVTTSSTSAKPEVDTYSVSDDATAANNLELYTEGTALGTLPKVDTTQINSVAAAAVQLAISAQLMVSGTVDNATFTPTTTQFEADDITEATADHFNGRTIIFTTGALVNQARRITDYALQNSKGFFTVDALTEAPANNDSFLII